MSHGDPFEVQRRSSSTSKGKEKQSFDEEDREDDDDDDTVDGEGGPEGTTSSADAAAETRRVEETLKRWEIAERQRRKVARVSAQMNTGPSILGGVTRRASLILAGRHPSHRSRNGLGNHRALKSRDSVDVVPLSDIEHSPQPLVHSPIPSLSHSRGTSDPVNPFIHPSETRLSLSSPHSPFADSKQLADTPKSNSPSHGERRGQSANPLRTSIPVTPPSGPSNPPIQNALQPTPPPVISSSIPKPEEHKAVRWWHEWLCGCGEGPDRGGDHQAARTNPFE
ncbi:hypothetical protein J3A83DRAFT_4091943 [Scleroderma citrinum]